MILQLLIAYAGFNHDVPVSIIKCQDLVHAAHIDDNAALIGYACAVQVQS